VNPIARKISSHPALAAKVQALLPAGMTLNQASKGFKNQGILAAASRRRTWIFRSHNPDR
jgi:hypothetical protein